MRQGTSYSMLQARRVTRGNTLAGSFGLSFDDGENFAHVWPEPDCLRELAFLALAALDPGERGAVIRRARVAAGESVEAVEASVAPLTREVFSPATHELDCMCSECAAALDNETEARR